MDLVTSESSEMLATESNTISSEEKTSEKSIEFKSTYLSEISPEYLQIFREKKRICYDGNCQRNNNVRTFIDKYDGKTVLIDYPIKQKLSEEFFRKLFTSKLDSFVQPITYSLSFPFVIFPYYEKSLSDHFCDEKNNIGIRERLEYAIDISIGLKEYHDICKKAIKNLNTMNMFIDKYGKIKIRYILSNDICQIPKEYENKTTNSNAFHTASFMAPEFFNDESILTTSFDIYSFGCVCFEMITRKNPYFGFSVSIIMKKLLKREKLECIPDIKGIPEDFIQLVYDCMNHDPEKRPSIDEIIKRLKAMLEQHTE
jgi:serine/threonine protein kinase